MNTDQFSSIVRSILKIIAGALVAHGATKAAAFINAEDTIGVILGIVGLVWSHVNHAPDANGTPASGQKNLPMVIGFLFFFGVFTSLFAVGCAHLDANADPLVVRTEQTLTSGKAGFDLVLHVEDANRAFYRTNAPGFHEFCEWLRQPQTIGTNTLPRAAAMLYSLDMVKLDYKASRATSNQLFISLTTAASALAQANQWTSVLNLTNH